jgi:hypothetical protein
MRSSCTQFACWGERTAGTDVQGGTIAGRNMDGEIDLRRVTVSHFVLFATAPGEAGHKRYVSMIIHTLEVAGVEIGMRYQIARFLVAVGFMSRTNYAESDAVNSAIVEETDYDFRGFLVTLGSRG